MFRRKNTAFEDITDFLHNATDALDVGELVHLPAFTLWDAMSAIEIMDPKMDAGMDLPADARKGKMRVDDIEGKHFSAGEIIGILDGLLSREMSWIAGHVLCQTLFTCVYLHRIPAVTNSILKYYLMSVARTASIIRSEILKAQIFLEEDFCVDTYGFSLCEEIGENEIARLLLDIEDMLVECARQAKAGEKITDLELVVPEGRELEYLNAISVRIRYRRSFFGTLTHLAQRDYTRAKKSLANAVSQLKLIQATLTLADDVSAAFDPYINRKSFTQTPPRPIVDLTTQDACTNAMAMLEHLQTICNSHINTALGKVHHVLCAFDRRKPGPDVLSRSIMQSMAVHEAKLAGRVPLQDAIKQSLVAICDPPYFNMMTSNVVDSVTKFLEMAVTPVTHMLQNYGFNRARQRRKLVKLAKEWEQLQVEAEMLDTQLQQDDRAQKRSRHAQEPFHLSSWVYNEKLNLLITMLSLGFELELYSPAEHLMVFWYLKHLYETKLEHLMRVEQVRQESLLRIGAGSKSKSRPNLPTPAEQWGGANADHNVLYAQQLIFTALFQIALALRKQSLLKRPQNDLYSERVHYERRFGLFFQLGSPVGLPYEMYEETIGFEEDTVPALLKAAEEHLKAAKQKLEQVYHGSGVVNKGAVNGDGDVVQEDYRSEVQLLMRTCVGNTVAIKTSGLGNVKKDGEGKGDVWAFKLLYHPCIPILSKTSG
ncbi:N-alpha-acetyltransferase 35 NatC auxiliary subunit [Rhizophlyctis rosea]|nr:N-alpha-acetyltransferase 35 NatC auxiliary subunit [Rhizophlyctis rosea]